MTLLCTYSYLLCKLRHLLILIFQNSAPVAQGNARPADIIPAKKKKEVHAGQIERCVGLFAANKLQLRMKVMMFIALLSFRFLSPLPSKSTVPGCIFTANNVSSMFQFTTSCLHLGLFCDVIKGKNVCLKSPSKCIFLKGKMSGFLILQES